MKTGFICCQTLICSHWLSCALRVWTLIHFHSHLSSNLHALPLTLMCSLSLNSHPLDLIWPQTLVHSHRLLCSQSWNSHPLSLLSGLKLPLLIMLSQSQNSHPLSLLFVKSHKLLPAGLYLITSDVWPWKLCSSCPDSTSHKAQVVSPLPVKIYSNIGKTFCLLFFKKNLWREMSVWF